jgi:hypothetical protein
MSGLVLDIYAHYQLGKNPKFYITLLFLHYFYNTNDPFYVKIVVDLFVIKSQEFDNQLQ